MDLQILETLKEKLLNSQEFTEIFSFFMDHFGENPEFMALGERTRHPFLESVVTQVGGQMMGRSIAVGPIDFIRVPAQQFIHGGFALEGRIGNVFYFEDILVGLVTVTPYLERGETKFARFTGRPLRTN